MKQKIGKLLGTIRSWNFDKKLGMMVTLLLVLSNIGNLVITTSSAVQSLKDKSSRFAQAQLTTINQILETEFKNIIADMESIAYDDYVKNYISYEEKSVQNSLANVNNAYQQLNNLASRNSLVDYAAIITKDKNTVLYSGEVWTNPDFKEKILENYYESTQKIEKNIRFHTMQKVFYPEEKVLNFYLPMNRKYDIRPNQPIAVLVVGIGENGLKKYLQTTEDSLPMNVYLTDSRGVGLISNTLIQSENEEKLNLSMEGRRGTVQLDGMLYMYQKMSD